MSTVPVTVTEPDAESCGLRERKKQRTRQAIHESAMRLVTERGLAGVTVEEICDDAGVSPRTFFNYFPAKGNAALGLPSAAVPDRARAAFTGADGPLVADLCDLVASTLELPTDRLGMKALVRERPEMVPTMLQWMADARVAVHRVACERTDAATASTAVTLVMAAVIETAHRSDADAVDAPDAFASRVRAVVREMGALAAS
ncbi:TetR/AcrR family transcriptional regulator [Curtobacterium sp. VKM Ac-2922]|uniref:TetR/AcrR family transcriptional regulator n=1 Tax=Curtobacterium sp. VKM Ac-2922 TaxID=2929475 RepID=UPI001FB4A211|nr:TetR/AcrR family transcriptional regulator [Curtobacterium sp. VKM Ac-2922]MCJ1714449.1 TetR/AcrR family transcriptional regulator [Curtobacterium sp. VKM Ac-2922]